MSGNSLGIDLAMTIRWVRPYCNNFESLGLSRAFAARPVPVRYAKARDANPLCESRLGNATTDLWSAHCPVLTVQPRLTSPGWPATVGSDYNATRGIRYST
jgi:hypothetical protein